MRDHNFDNHPQSYAFWVLGLWLMDLGFRVLEVYGCLALVFDSSFLALIGLEQGFRVEFGV